MSFKVFCYFSTIACSGFVVVVVVVWVSSFLLVEVVNLTHARVIQENASIRSPVVGKSDGHLD